MNQHTRYSLNEIGGLCKRATRGAGLSWGLAEDAARGVRWLSGLALPGPRLLVARLGLLKRETMQSMSPVALAGEWRAGDGLLCPLVTGAALSDSAALLATERSIGMHQLLCPLLLAPFAADVALALGTPVCVEWNQFKLTTDGLRLSLAGASEHLHQQECQYLACRIAERMPDDCLTAVMRGEVSDDDWECLSFHAARTYAPATEASRRLGAGAGTPDGS